MIATERAIRRIESGEIVHRCHRCHARLLTEDLPPMNAEPNAGHIVRTKCYNCNADNSMLVGKCRGLR